MGQREEYLESSEDWDATLAREERLSNWWKSASFGIGLSGKAARALDASERAVATAEAARTMVRHQAVYALLNEGLSVREIAARLGLSKSKTGRMVKALTREGQIKSAAFAPPRGAEDGTRDLVLSAWRFSERSDLTRDHPRGAPDISGPGESTNFGGLNGPR